jgi:hypothetical protein
MPLFQSDTYSSLGHNMGLSQKIGSSLGRCPLSRPRFCLIEYVCCDLGS